MITLQAPDLVMDHLSDAQLAALRSKLEAELELLRGRIVAGTEGVADNPDTGPRDIEDAAQQEAGRFQAGQLLGRDRAGLAALEAALARMDAGSYGLCEESDEPIPFRRLELRPTTRYSAAAQEDLEDEAGERDPHRDEPIGY